MTNSLSEVMELLRQQLPGLRETYAVSEMGVFGSFVRDEAADDSDLDVLVAFAKTPSLMDLAGLKNHLQDVIGREVDVVMRDALKRHIAPYVLREVRYL